MVSMSHRGLVAIVFITFVIIASGLAFQLLHGSTSMNTSTMVMQTVNQLIEGRLGGPRAVERLFNVTLAPAAGTNEYFNIEGAELSERWRPLNHVEIRWPVTDSDKGGLIELNLNHDSSCFTKNDMVWSLGVRYEMSMQSPPIDVRNENTSYTYVQDWGRLSFTINSSAPDCVSSIVIDFP
jgi:hypothetical protein